MERRTPVEVFHVEYECDECGEAMKSLPYMLTSNPPLYPHECPNGHKKNFYFRYPKVSYSNTGE